MKSLEEITLHLYIQYLTLNNWGFKKEEAYKLALGEAKYFRKRMQKTLARLPKQEPIEYVPPFMKGER